MRIAIIGYSGGGKSTMATALAKHYNLPKLHLDQIYFQPYSDWQARPSQDFRRDLEDFLDRHDNWVLDGNYKGVLLDRRLESANQIIFFDFPRWLAFGRLIKRYLANRRTNRSSAPTGCKEHLRWNFVLFVLFKARCPEQKEKYKKICQEYASKVTILRSQKDIDNFLTDLADF